MAQLAVPAVSGFILYLIWLLVRNFFVRSPLDKIPGPPRGSIIAGNIFQISNHDGWGFVNDLVETYGPLSKCHGFFGTRVLHTYDLKAMHSVYIKDQDSYYRGEKFINLTRLLVGPGLMGTYGATHKKQRKMLNPVFSGGHMRNLTPLFYDVADRLRIALESRVKDGPKDLDVVAWMGRTSLELIGRGGLGCSFDPLVADSQDVFTESVKKLLPATDEVVWTQVFSPYLRYLGPAWLRRFLLELVPIPGVQRLKTISDIVSKRMEEIYFAKKAAIESGDSDLLHAMGEGKDIISVLLRENMKASDEDRLPDEEVLAQMGTVIVAGVDTTSNALSRVLHLLCMNQDVQAQLRSELHEAQEQYGKEIPYDELCALPYLDAVCREMLRLYAPVTTIGRQARVNTVLPLSEPVRCTDGTIVREVPVPEGTTIFLNVQACNTNKAIWGEDAGEWKPERWLQPLPKAVEDAHIPGIYANLMTFISGGNSCIGLKFSQLEMKIILSILVSNFHFALSPDKPIFWNFGVVAYPVTDHASSKPEMNLKVGLVSR